MDLDKLKFPVGIFSKPDNISSSDITQWIETIAEFPQKVIEATESLTLAQLNWTYRPAGWTIKQVVHHCGDSHMNSLIRFKLALTEDSPTIKPYFEDRWAELPDSLDDDISISLNLLKSLHSRWVILLKSLDADQLERTFVHPEHGTSFTLAETIANYAWHCNHHLAHILQAIAYKGRF